MAGAANSKSSYENSRQQNMLENKKKMEALKLHQLAPAPRNIVKRARPRTFEKQIVQLRRSTRVSNHSSPVYKEVIVEKVVMPGKSYPSSRQKDLSNHVDAYASEEARAATLQKARELESGLGSDHPTFVKTMIRTHVTVIYHLSIDHNFGKENISKADELITLIGEDGNEYPVLYSAQRYGLAGGWKAFAAAHDLVEGDALVFQLIQPTTFKVYIVRVEGSEGSSVGLA